MTQEYSIDQLTKVYLKIKAKRDELSAAFKINDGELVKQQDSIKAALLEYCKENKVNSANTDFGTVIRSVKTRYWTSDWESMYGFIIEENVPEFFTKSLHQGNVKTFMEENPDKLPPGLNVDSEYVISIRKPTKKR